MQPEELSAIWDYYKPRHTHAWNMLVLAFNQLREQEPIGEPFEAEYAWENIILRLWLYRTVVKTLTKLHPVKQEAENTLRSFDKAFDHNGINGLKALRDMIEHFDDYAADHGRGPVTRAGDLDPWRTITRDEYDRGQFMLSREKALLAADEMRANAKQVSDQFIEWYHSQ
ncbi:MAG: hypothetical protein V3V30_10000 [Parvularculaceae bacterium]